MKRKIVFVSFLRLTTRVERDWYIKDLLERGVEVEYWDVVRALRQPHEEVDSIKPPYLLYFQTLKEIEARLRQPDYDNAIFVLLITYTGGFTNIYALLSRYNRKMSFIARSNMPTNPKPAWKKVAERWANPAWLLRLAYGIGKAKAMRRLGFVKPFDMVFAAGRVAMRTNLFARRVIPINAHDYDEFVRVRSAPTRLVDARYAVFLDINLPYQSDLAVCGLPVIAAAEYFAAMNGFFQRIERELGMQVVVAAHPKTAYGAERFEGRTTMRGRTAELVRDASLVLTHTSTSLSYAVLNRKPLMFTHTEAMRREYKDTVMRELANFATYLNAPLVNAEGFNDGLSMPTVDEGRYAAYQYDFLTSTESEGQSSRDIFCAALTA